jgi:hypothetical protein
VQESLDGPGPGPLPLIGSAVMKRTICAVIAVAVVGGGAGLLSGCTDNPLYCASNADCKSPTPFCDIEGEYGDHIGHSCVEDPFAVDGGNPPGPDAQVFDADPNAPDASPEPDAPPGTADAGGELPHADQVILTEIKVTNDLSQAGLPNGMSGARVNISFSHPEQDTGVTIGDGSPGTCTITTYDLGASQHPAPQYDEQKITITGAQQTIGDCTFRSVAEGYVCSPRPAAVFSSSATMTAVQGGLFAISDASADFQQLALTGGFIKLTGFSSSGNNGLFPIVSQNQGTIIIANPPGSAESPGGHTYELRSGVGYSPSNTPFFDAQNQITLSKISGSEYSDFTMFLGVTGEGFDLDNASSQPHQLPGSPGDVTFSCGGNGGNCGNTSSNEAFSAMVITGHTTDASLNGMPPWAMPPPVQRFANFTCTVLSGTSITLPEEILATAMGTGATRIETIVSRFSGNLVLGATDGQLRIAVGHSLVGYTNVDP